MAFGRVERLLPSSWEPITIISRPVQTVLGLGQPARLRAAGAAAIVRHRFARGSKAAPSRAPGLSRRVLPQTIISVPVHTVAIGARADRGAAGRVRQVPVAGT